MSTRARIGLELSDGSILSAYHHWDGYPEWLGRILNTHYNSKDAVAELIDGGDMSICWTKERWNFDGSSCEVEEYGPQYYEREIDGENPPCHDADLCEYLLPDNSEEYAYVFRNGQWVCYDMHQFEESKLPEVVEIPSGALAV